MPLVDDSIVITHNLDPDDFMWLWAKYVRSTNLAKHCTACLGAATVRSGGKRGSEYSQRFSRARNPDMKRASRLTMDECAPGSFTAIYLCGVSAGGYATKKNYPHNLHAAILPAPNKTDSFEFENYRLSVENGTFTRIPTVDELSAAHRRLPAEFTTCRIFRWAACVFPVLPSPAARLPAGGAPVRPGRV